MFEWKRLRKKWRAYKWDIDCPQCGNRFQASIWTKRDRNGKDKKLKFDAECIKEDVNGII